MDMIERVARAICQRNDYYWPENNILQERWFLDARAALEALRDPSEEMRRAFTATSFNNGDPDAIVPLTGTGQGDLTMVKAYEDVWFILAMDERWNAMIDAALKDR